MRSKVLSRIALLTLLGVGGGCTTHSVRPSRVFVREMPAASVIAETPMNVPEIPPSAEPVPETPLTMDEVIDRINAVGGKLRTNGEDQITEADFSFSGVTNDVLLHISLLPALEELDLTGSQVTNAGLLPIGQLSSLKSLKLKGVHVGDDGIRELSGLQSLVLLDASHTEITNASLPVIATLTSLRYLSLNDTQISDEGLESLAPLKALRGLSLINTGVTEEGVSRLKKQLPECLIVARNNAQISCLTPEARGAELAEFESGVIDQAAVSTRQTKQVAELAQAQPQLAVHLSRVYSDACQWNAAAEVLASAAAVAPEDESIHLALGEALAHLGQTQEALQHYQRVVSAAEARYRVGMIVYEENLRDCGQFFTDACAEDPELDAARDRSERIARELAALRGTRLPDDPSIPEIIPGSLPVRTASQSESF